MGEEETVSQPFKYVGQVGILTEDDNLYYMRARYYDAETGWFISEDPAGFVDGPNLYAYVGGNPIMLVDPSGEFGAVGAAIGAGLELGVQLTLNGGDFGAVDYADVFISGAVGFVAPGALTPLSKLSYSGKAINTLKTQQSAARTTNRLNKVNSRIDKHVGKISDEIVTQVSLQGVKYAGKKLFDSNGSGSGQSSTGK